MLSHEGKTAVSVLHKVAQMGLLNSIGMLFQPFPLRGFVNCYIQTEENETPVTLFSERSHLRIIVESLLTNPTSFLCRACERICRICELVQVDVDAVAVQPCRKKSITLPTVQQTSHFSYKTTKYSSCSCTSR